MGVRPINGYISIDNTQNVECNDGTCEVSGCCNLFCNSRGCPNGFTPIENALNGECQKGQVRGAFLLLSVLLVPPVAQRLHPGVRRRHHSVL